MNRRLILLAFFLFPTVAFSQYDFGLKVGVNGADLMDESSFKSAPDFKPKLSFNGGVYVNFHLFEKLNVLSELNYSNKGSRFPDAYSGPGKTINLNYLNLSFLASYQVRDDFYLEGGIETSYLISSFAKLDDGRSVDYSVDNNFDLGPIMGIRYRLFDKASLELRYIIGLIRPTDSEIFISGDRGNEKIEQLKYRNHLLQLNFSYAFVRK